MTGTSIVLNFRFRQVRVSALQYCNIIIIIIVISKWCWVPLHCVAFFTLWSHISSFPPPHASASVSRLFARSRKGGRTWSLSSLLSQASLSSRSPSIQSSPSFGGPIFTCVALRRGIQSGCPCLGLRTVGPLPEGTDGHDHHHHHHHHHPVQHHHHHHRNHHSITSTLHNLEEHSVRMLLPQPLGCWPAPKRGGRISHHHQQTFPSLITITIIHHRYAHEADEL